MAPMVEKLPIPPTALGEGPHWVSKSQTLYMVDILNRKVIKYVPATKETASAEVDSKKTTHFIIPIKYKSDLFALATGRKVFVIRWDGENDSKVEFVKELMEIDKDAPNNIINDGKVDRMGNLYTGTMGISPSEKKGLLEMDPSSLVPIGAFYCRTKDGVVKKLDSGVTVSNGIAIDGKRKLAYHVDSLVHAAVRRFDHDEKTGDTTNKSIVFDYKKAGYEGVPDGMTVDTNGNLWVASCYGGQVLNIDPNTGEVITTIAIPDKGVTSCTFGGKNFDILYVTTLKDQEGNGGNTYAVTGLGVQGSENHSLPLDL